MKQFQVLRYLKRWRYLILAITLAGAVLFYNYASDRQTYTASVAIRYTNPGASQGLRPDGEPIDVTEIFSSKVIAGALEELGSGLSNERVRSNCDVKEIIPEDELTRKEAILENGDEYEYFATDYLVRYTADSTSSAENTRRILSSILDFYFKGYAERYINETVLPDNAANVANSSYDYIERVDLLEAFISDVLYILDGKRDTYKGFRSAQTGYSFNDLYLIYKYIYDNTIPYLYSQVLDNALSRDKDVLTSKYSQDITNYKQIINNNEEKLTYLDRIILEYGQKLVDKLNESDEYTNRMQNGNNVLQNVYGWRDNGVYNHTITYDTLLYQRIDYQLNVRNAEINTEHAQDMLGVFEKSTKDHSDSIDKIIENATTELSELHETLNVTYSEFNDYLAAQNLRVLSNVNVYEGLNIKLYLVLAIAVFFICGCVGSIILGRGEDFLEYIIYNDSKTGLPNRARCDQEIAKYENTVLPDDFCCAIVSLDNLRFTNEKDGYTVGNLMLRQMGLILSEVTHGLGFVGYNNTGHYLCLLDSCTKERADAMLLRIGELVDKFNLKHPDEKMEVSTSVSCTTENKIYDIRLLVRDAYQHLGKRGGAA